MDRDKLKNVSWGFLIAVIICLVLYKISSSMFFLVLGCVIMAGNIVLDIVFNRCPYCGHNLSQHHWYIEYCPYCGGYLTMKA